MRAGIRTWVGVVVAALVLPSAANAQPGLYLPGSGAAHAGMAGVSTAAPVDAIGALYWNPAAIGRLGHSEVSIGGIFVYPEIAVRSSFPRVLEGRVEAGRTRSDGGFIPTSAVGVVYQPEDDRLTYGMGIFTLAGAGVNFPGDPGNPVLSPLGPLRQNVLGPIYANVGILQLAPTASYRVTDRLVLGAGPTINAVFPSFDPAFFTPPDDANGDGLGTFPTATHTRPFWGGGFRAGLVYSVTDAVDVGFGYTSPQWLETWRFHARDELGRPRTLFLDASLPAIYSWGVAYRGIDRLTLAVDLRYFDYANTDLFGEALRDGGLGWDSAFAVAVGTRYLLTDRVAVQAGYQYNTNPLANTSTLFNVQSPAITQHLVTAGTTLAVTDSMAMSLGYAYGFRNSIAGTAREVPGAGVGLDAESHSLLFTMQFKFGGCGRQSPCVSNCEAAPVTMPAE